MRESLDGVVRQMWPQDLTGVTEELAKPFPVKAAPRRPSADAIFDERFAAWESWIEDAVDDDIEDGGDGQLSGADIAPSLAANLLTLVDRAVADVERRTGEAAAKAASTIDALRDQVARLQSARRLDAERHRRTVERLAERIKTHELETSAKVDKVHDALTLMEAEAAEARSVDRLRTSSWIKRHRALVQQRLVQRELTKGSLQ